MTGSITQVGENKYRIFISNGFTLDGKRIRRTKTITTDLKGRDLKKFLELEKIKFGEEVSKKDPKFDKLARSSFEEYAIWWLDYKENDEGIAPTTVVYYRKMLNNRVIKFIGHKTLEKITNADMLELMRMIRESPAKTKTGKLSEKSIKHHHTLLNTMFNDAITLKVLSENPMENITVRTPQVILKDNYYDLEELNQLLTLLPNEPIKYQLATLLTISTGMRVGELTALQWKHIDMQNMKIKIEQSNAYTHETGSFIKETKNETSERTVAFPNVLINLFLEHKEDETLKREMMKNKWINYDNDQSEDFVFTQENGEVIFVGTIPKWFRKFIRKNDLRHITFHGLRHTNSTVLIGKGINIVSVSHVLGHAKTSTTTDFYAHHLESVERTMANVFDEIITENQNYNWSGTESGTKNENLKIVK